MFWRLCLYLCVGYLLFLIMSGQISAGKITVLLAPIESYLDHKYEKCSHKRLKKTAVKIFFCWWLDVASLRDCVGQSKSCVFLLHVFCLLHHWAQGIRVMPGRVLVCHVCGTEPKTYAHVRVCSVCLNVCRAAHSQVGMQRCIALYLV